METDKIYVYMIPWLDSKVSLAERYVHINKYTSVIIIAKIKCLTNKESHKLQCNI